MKTITPTKAIRLHCLDCSNGQYKEVQNCVIDSCPLYPFRVGKNPNYPKVNRKSPIEGEVEKNIENSKEFLKIE